MKNILILEDCLVKGEPVSKGDVLKNVDNATAAQLLTSGRCQLAPAKEADPEPVKPAKKKVSKKKAD